MASIKNLKKEINYIFGEVIDEANYKQLLNPEVDNDKVEAIIDETVTAYEDYYEKIHAGRKAKDKKSFFKELNNEIEKSVNALIEKINAL